MVFPREVRTDIYLFGLLFASILLRLFMQIRYNIITLIALCLTAGACHRSATFSPEQQQAAEVAQGYLNAMANYNPDAAMPYSSQETQEYTIPFFRNIIGQLDTNYIKSQMPATIVIDSITIKPGDTTALVFFSKTTPTQTKHQQLDMVKRQGKWQAYVPTQVPEALEPHRPLTTQDLRNMHIEKVEKAVKNR